MSPYEKTPYDKKSGDREIVYHVGWKKGKIHMHDNLVTSPAAAREIWFHHYVWKPVDFLSEQAALILFLSLPVICFGCIVWLVYLLSHANM